MKKQRLDSLLVERGLVSNEDTAGRFIMSGIVYVNSQKSDKPGLAVPLECEIEIRQTGDFASRGGYKLEHALEHFNIDVSGVYAIDTGASTGGFTDCLLKHSAAYVWAIDVGYGQLAWGLRNDERVCCMERTNIRAVTPDQLGRLVDFASLDLSFISLKVVLPVIRKLLKSDGQAVCLVKPQFEAKREQVGKNGVIREPEIHVNVLQEFCFTANQNGFIVKGLTFSPIKGPKGNIEFLTWIGSGNDIQIDLDDIHRVVEKAHRELSNI